MSAAQAVLRGLCPKHWQEHAGSSAWSAAPALHRQPFRRCVCRKSSHIVIVLPARAAVTLTLQLQSVHGQPLAFRVHTWLAPLACNRAASDQALHHVRLAMEQVPLA